MEGPVDGDVQVGGHGETTTGQDLIPVVAGADEDPGHDLLSRAFGGDDAGHPLHVGGR